ncbi:MAG TPA: adenosylhomocysteinase [Anaerolineales bacterium]|nr:adenosylhomocysteinase [Anaerolineales bacterium]
MEIPFENRLEWARRHMPRLGRALSDLPDLGGVRLAFSMHLDLKIVPLVEGLLARGAQVTVVTCNPATVRDEVVAYLKSAGAQAQAWRDMPAQAYRQAAADAIAWGPTHLCEFGADLTSAWLASPAPPPVRASLEGTGSGIARLQRLAPPYPIFNWDDLPIKEGLHNRHMVGLTTWHTFFARTGLTLHGRRVAVIGYGLVGQGVAASGRAYGGTVLVVERDPSRALQAAFEGWAVLTLEEALPQADVVVTATGAAGVLAAIHLPLLRDGAFLVNVGHHAGEIDLPALLAHPHREILPHIEEVDLDGRRVYLFARGEMANLAAGEGDSLNAFDVTLAILARGLGYLVGPGSAEPPGVYLLPRSVWEGAVA